MCYSRNNRLSRAKPWRSQGEARGTKIEISSPQFSPVVLYDVLGGVLVDVESYRGCKMSVPVSIYVCPDGYKAQFLRYLDENFMEGVFQYYLEVLFLVFEKNFKKEKKFQKNP